MRDLTKRFLSNADRDAIGKAVNEAEKMTSGEIVPMVVSASYDYPMASVIGGTTASLPLALLLTPVLGEWFWIGPRDMWLFLGIFAFLFLIFHEVVKRTYWLKRMFISPREIDEEVEEAAVINFYREGLYRTRDETGILIFISIFERKVRVLADRGINQKVKQEEWDETVRLIVEGIRQNRQAEAIREAVGKAGEMLQEHFPVQPDDRDELQNLIIKD